MGNLPLQRRGTSYGLCLDTRAACLSTRAALVAMKSIATQGLMKYFFRRVPDRGETHVTYHASRLFICPVVNGSSRHSYTDAGTRQLYLPERYTPSSSLDMPRRWRF